MKIALIGVYPKGTIQMFKSILSNYKVKIEIVDTEEKYKDLYDADIMVLRTFKIEKEDIERNTNLKLIHKWGTGFDTIDIKTAGENNILVCNSPGANSYAVSELTMLHILSTYRNLINNYKNVEKGNWSKSKFLNQSYCIKNKTVGLIGIGNIGKEVANKVQVFGAKVQYYDIFRLSREVEQQLNIKYVELEELCKSSDIISLHVPINEKTRYMINKDMMKLMKPTAIIINTSRGGLIKEKDLIDALEEGKILGAGLDCIENEPIEINDPILKAPNLTITPHIGGTSADLIEHMVPLICNNIIAYIEKKNVKFLVNEKYLKN